MISKNRLKQLTAFRQQQRCDEEGVFVVEGVKMATEAMAANCDILVVCATAEWLAAEGSGLTCEVQAVGPSELERLSHMRSPNQVWMLVRRPTIDAVEGRLTLALDRIQDPGNMGTIMRTADWFGVRHIVCSRDTVSCYNPKVVQASMGAVFRTRVDYVDLPQWLGACGRRVFGASLGGTPLDGSVGTEPAVLVVGNESRGISAEVMACVDRPVLIPNLGGTAESLNAAVAAAILIDKITSPSLTSH